ncbi:MAG TPA: asparagine synthase (glutamine-hydrolyzing) [Candidatus Bathyarchaeia archaeon]|nr:asparagine synthase (glutamine-hydrolyzing) [Candidatus Bathyarchaeia archaeon]
MCGIAGYVGFNDEALLKNMIGALKHRGPDDTGFYTDDQVGLANARLSIIDIEGGHQPQHNEDGTVHVTYNGEIYNFQHLRSELEKLGHKFSTRSDTEVIVHGYEEYGNGFVQRLNGMFAIAIWDSRQKKLLLARDRIGIKPLYYVLDGSRLFFASEIKALLHVNLKRTVDCQALYSILNIGYIPGSRTLIEGVSKLPPSSLLVFQNGRMEVSNYWSMPATSPISDDTWLIGNLRLALQESVRDQLIADVPVGCFLSGGLDTSTLVAFASKVTTQPLKTFCMGFGEETDEFQDARLIAEHFGTDHHELIVDSSQAMKLYPRMIWHMEAPKYNLYPWFVCELVRKHVTVCLSGNGGDELFGGYVARYENALRIDELSRKGVSPILHAAGGLGGISNDTRIQNRFRVLQSLGDNTNEYLILAGVMPDSFNHQLFKSKFSTNELRNVYGGYFSNGSNFVDGLMRAELRTKLVDDLLSVDDTMSMAHSLELRVPLLDNRLVDLMMPLPWRSKILPGKYGKLQLRKVMKDELPEESFRKPKWGFSVNVYNWYKGELGELIRQIVPESKVVREYFSQTRIQKLIAHSNVPKARRHQILLWQLFGFHFWHKIFIESENPEQAVLEINTLAA